MPTSKIIALIKKAFPGEKITRSKKTLCGSFDLVEVDFFSGNKVFLTITENEEMVECKIYSNTKTVCFPQSLIIDSYGL